MKNTIKQNEERMEGENNDKQYVIEEIEALKRLFTTMQSELTTISEYRINNEESINEKIEHVKGSITTENLDTFVKTYKEKIEPAVLNEVAKGKDRKSVV